MNRSLPCNEHSSRLGMYCDECVAGLESRIAALEAELLRSRAEASAEKEAAADCGLGKCGTVTECADCGRGPDRGPSKQPPLRSRAEVNGQTAAAEVARLREEQDELLGAKAILESLLRQERERAAQMQITINVETQAKLSAERACATERAALEAAESEVARLREENYSLRLALKSAERGVKAFAEDLATERAAREALSRSIDSAIRDMLSGGHPFEKGVAKAINELRAAQALSSFDGDH